MAHRFCCMAHPTQNAAQLPQLFSGLLTSIVLLALGGLNLNSAQAQVLYKSVGPDGKVVYSDQPPASNQYNVLSRPATASNPATATATTPAPSNSTASNTDNTMLLKGQAKKALALAPAPVAPAPTTTAVTPPKPLDPALEGAVVGTLGVENLVTQTEKICLETLPTSFKRYSSATEGWQSRNADLVKQAKLALSKAFAASDRPLLQAAIAANNDNMLKRVKEADRYSRIKWCDQSSEEISIGKMDISSKPKLATPLLAYR